MVKKYHKKGGGEGGTGAGGRGRCIWQVGNICLKTVFSFSGFWILKLADITLKIVFS